MFRESFAKNVRNAPTKSRKSFPRYAIEHLIRYVSIKKLQSKDNNLIIFI